jgi:beta-mannosidase
VKEGTLHAAFGELPDVGSTLRATQLLQFEGLRYAVEADRRRKYHSSGSLPWQLNEPYPMAACTSAVDYFGRPKPAYYAVAAAYEPLHVSARFERQAWAGHETFQAEVWANNSRLEDVPATLQLALAGLGGRLYAARSESVTCPADAAARLTAVSHALRAIEDEVFFLDLRLTGTGAQVLSHNRYLFVRGASLAPLLAVPATELEAEVVPAPLPAPLSGERQASKEPSLWQVTLRNRGATAALMVWLEDAREVDAPGYAAIEPNYFCLLPGEARQVLVTWAGIPQEDRKLEAAGWNTQVLELCLQT